jgi:hypothetical protein
MECLSLQWCDGDGETTEGIFAVEVRQSCQGEEEAIAILDGNGDRMGRIWRITARRTDAKP